ncbi:hypothetical protein BDQ17DRAFT_289703 [Cyathus striatus]|nr:hypothetical protein BDQ17DRAFT_289703 [Cyathus striatus]
MSSDHTFLFASLDSKYPLSTRKIHIRRLYDILQLSIQRHDLPRAKRAWAILVRCTEIPSSLMCTTGLCLLNDSFCFDTSNSSRTIQYLRMIMLQHEDQKEYILQEIVFQLILSERYREGLDELELYLPSFPYQDNPILHLYAGMICLFLSQPEQKEARGHDATLLREAQARIEHAKILDPNNIVAQGLLAKVCYQ